MFHIFIHRNLIENRAKISVNLLILTNIMNRIRRNSASIIAINQNRIKHIAIIRRYRERHIFTTKDLISTEGYTSIIGNTFRNAILHTGEITIEGMRLCHRSEIKCRERTVVYTINNDRIDSMAIFRKNVKMHGIAKPQRSIIRHDRTISINLNVNKIRILSIDNFNSMIRPNILKNISRSRYNFLIINQQ